MSTTGARTIPVRVRGLLLNPPDGGGPREVYVNDDDAWALIYKQPDVKVACLDPGCATLLTAKQMSRSGLRFFARRSGDCSHFVTGLPIESDEVKINPMAPGTGGGPEGDEHLWVKGRLYTIARTRLGEDPIVEESMTHADVFLARSKLVLEYQRWTTEFDKRSQARLQAGAHGTIWLVPDRPSHKTSFRAAVRRGAMYLEVVDRQDRRRHLEPRHHPQQNRDARLYVSGSIVTYDYTLESLVRHSRPLDVVLREIIAGERVLEWVDVYTKSSGRTSTIRAWVLKSDLALRHEAQEHRHTAPAQTSMHQATAAVTCINAPTTGTAAPGTDLPAAAEEPPVMEPPRLEYQEPDNPWIKTTSSGTVANPWLTAVPVTSSDAPAPAILAPAPVVAEPTAPCAETPLSAHRSVWERIAAWFRRE